MSRGKKWVLESLNLALDANWEVNVLNFKKLFTSGFLELMIDIKRVGGMLFLFSLSLL